MRVAGIALLCCLLACCTADSASGARPEPTPEAKWAKGIASDFWGAIRDRDAGLAMALLSPELAKALTSYDDGGELKQFIPPLHLRHLERNYGHDASVSFDTEDVAPDRTEVLLKGSLSGKDRSGEAVTAEFTMRVAKEANGGKWSIRFLRVVDRRK